MEETIAKMPQRIQVPGAPWRVTRRRRGMAATICRTAIRREHNGVREGDDGALAVGENGKSAIFVISYL